ncbi:MAG TPA: EamA family transporter [Cyanobacteria bacterium UBA8803]|nr:EamA family transporter [Cyanobacteria bacterium UBA9273]HBL62221.1 EamA family transporter [Cyanobacteria bacterium UBA8803]
MPKLIAKNSKLINRIPGRAYLLLAMIIFAASSSVIRKLTEIGAQNLIDGRNPISFCNVFFAGNICALALLIAIYHQQWNAGNLKRFSRGDWLGLMGVAILEGALAPALIFTALSLTMVNNVILIGRIEPPLTLALSVWLLRERVNRWVVAGAIASFVGVVLTVLLQPPGATMVNMGMSQVGKGELMVAGWAVCIAISTIISKVKLRHIPLGIFTIFRAVVGTIIFGGIVLKLFGVHHFIDIFSPFLWQWMLVYSVVIVVGGQLCFFTGLKKSSASDVSLASSFGPIAGILAAYLLLGEAPTMAHYIGGSIIMVGIVLNQIGVGSQSTEMVKAVKAIPVKEMDNSVGFKGV